MGILAKKIAIAAPIDSKREVGLRISDYIETILIHYNYKVTKRTDFIVVFEPFGGKPVTRNEASYFIERGQFECVSEIGKETLVILTYSISFDMEVMALLLITAFGIFASPIAFTLCLFIILPSIQRFYKIKNHADEMLLAITDR